MLKQLSILLALLFMNILMAYAQHDERAYFVFYNVENLFDLVDDSLTADEEFTPDGAKHWTAGRYYDKIDRIARTLSSVGEWEMPALIGMCEVENRNVIQDLIEHRYLKATNYSVLHRESPDSRGIDVAFLYNPAVFSADTAVWIPVNFPFAPESATRDILYVRGLIFKTDTLHVFINHWPSRWGGVEATKPKRAEAALQLRAYIDSLCMVFRDPRLIIAGDLNDNPTDAAVHEILGAKKNCDGKAFCLVNLMLDDYHRQHYGSLKYKSDWEVYDQLIVSSPLLSENGLRVRGGDAHIFRAPFLLTEDERYMGYKPLRTYAGPRYLDGYSDHLPVYLELVK
jgi:hypothetical protein